MEHKRRQHGGTDQGEIEPGTKSRDKEHEISEVPDDITDTDTEENQIDIRPRGTSDDKDGKDKVNQSDS